MSQILPFLSAASYIPQREWGNSGCLNMIDFPPLYQIRTNRETESIQIQQGI